MNKIILLVPVLFLQGCLWQTVNKTDIYYAKQLCKEVGSEFKYINEYWSGGTEVMCEDGKLYSLKHHIDEVLERGIDGG